MFANIINYILIEKSMTITIIIISALVIYIITEIYYVEKDYKFDLKIIIVIFLIAISIGVCYETYLFIKKNLHIFAENQELINEVKILKQNVEILKKENQELIEDLKLVEKKVENLRYNEKFNDLILGCVSVIVICCAITVYHM